MQAETADSRRDDTTLINSKNAWLGFKDKIRCGKTLFLVRYALFNWVLPVLASIGRQCKHILKNTIVMLEKYRDFPMDMQAFVRSTFRFWKHFRLLVFSNIQFDIRFEIVSKYSEHFWSFCTFVQFLRSLLNLTRRSALKTLFFPHAPFTWRVSNCILLLRSFFFIWKSFWRLLTSFFIKILLNLHFWKNDVASCCMHFVRKYPLGIGILTWLGG